MDTTENSADRVNPYSELLEGTCPEKDRHLIRDIRGATQHPEGSEADPRGDAPAAREMVVVTRDIRPARRVTTTPNGA